MGARTEHTEPVDLPSLLGTIARDAKRLVGQQLELFRAELGQELRQAGGAAASVAAGGGLAAAGGLFGGFMLAHLIRRLTGAPLWACYGLVGGSLGTAGLALLRSGRNAIADLRPLPQTTGALGENLEWLARELNPTG
ncbi:MAG TPA: phage holin family protein [Gemmataceae bacterium]|nr:phage holin family protein [Gemmataceae bacterium]